jgi:hypothetical protein
VRDSSAQAVSDEHGKVVILGPEEIPDFPEE